MIKRLFLLFFFLWHILVVSNEKVFHNIYFETDKSIVTEIEKNRLFSFIKTLTEKKIDKVEIFGFCDDIGASEYNLVLSQKRANSIKLLFEGFSVSSDKITSVNGKGEVLFKTIKASNPDVIRALNRKVEVLVYYSKNVEKDDGSVENPKVGKTYVLNNILFLTGYSYLSPSSKISLSKLADTIKNADFNFIIQGHVCCTAGIKDAVDKKTKQRNLSVSRARYVYNYFISKGISKDRMSYEGLGHRFPLGGKPENDRRVEILIISN